MRSSMFVVLNEHSEVLLQGFKGRRRFLEPVSI